MVAGESSSSATDSPLASRGTARRGDAAPCDRMAMQVLELNITPPRLQLIQPRGAALPIGQPGGARACLPSKGGGGVPPRYRPGGCLTDWTGSKPDTVSQWQARVEKSVCHGKRAVLWNRSCDSYWSMRKTSTR